MYQLQANDIVFIDDAQLVIRNSIESNRAYSSQWVSTYGKSTPINNIPTSVDNIRSSEDAVAYSQWVVKLFNHSKHIYDNPELLLPLVNNSQSAIDIKHSGIQSKWNPSENLSFVRIRPEAVRRILDGVAVITKDEPTYRLTYQFVDERLSDAFIGDANKPMLHRALWYAKRNLLTNMLTSSGVEFTIDRSNDKHNLLLLLGIRNSSITISQASMVSKIVDQYNNLKVNPTDLSRYKQNVLQIQAQQLRSEESQRRQLATKTFGVYWDNLKTRQRSQAPTEEQAATEFATIPLADAGTLSSRTWGIEIETVRANETSRPAGWSDVHDGSLPDGDDCNCDCDYCYDGSHGDCDDDSCSTGNDSREFVSPILSNYNSDGLRKLCTDLGDYESSTAPGIHVHVGADDLTVTDVARLLFAYGAVAPYLKPLYHRKEYGYCNEMDGSNVQWWLSAVKSWLRTQGTVPVPRDICHEQPASRYQDVNLHAMSKHGTIEFRSMGPFYNYEHLVRWAWFVREMVNVSKLGLDQRLWTACSSLTDVIQLLRKYGSEMPLDKLPTTTSTIDLVLVGED